MKKISLDKSWVMEYNGKTYIADVPCSVYKTLIENNMIPDPYYRENEYISTGICDMDYTFEKHFDAPEKDSHEKNVLRFDGIDTLSEVRLNGRLLGMTDNMHRIYEYDVEGILKDEDNILSVKLLSPNEYITKKQTERPLTGVEHCMAGYPHLRKAHCMFGWDWGPKLPDMGIWRSVSLCYYDGGRINNVYYTQKHEGGKVTVCCKADIEIFSEEKAEVRLTVTSPEGRVQTALLNEGRAEIVIEGPKLWWVTGLGEQPLYDCKVELICGGKTVDTHTRRIGLRTLTISRDKDEWGEEFCFINNGVKIFAMGANYIPEDQIVTRCTKERTVKLLEDCKAANYNFIRVWGGGYYPDEYFYDWCDENGFIVWQDFMFACSAYLLTEGFEATVREEFRDNIIRLRNHASLGMWCGNNEIESAWVGWGWPDDKECKADYLRLFEDIIPTMLKEYDPETFYWPSSPSSGGKFEDPSSNHAGDMHYWDVWHNFKPIEAFRQYHYRFCSEYGFESLPDIKTCRYFANEDKGDFDLCGNVMQAHQKCTQGNEKVMYYLAQMVNYPYDLQRLIYCSQIVQADCIRSNVEHMRRARGRCMGSAYWQVNDSNPVISWSSIDYFGRWKALHYYARKFYAPILISCDDSEPMKPALYVSNDTLEDEELTIIETLRGNDGRVICMSECRWVVKAMSAKKMCMTDYSAELAGREDKRTKYLEYKLIKNGEVISGGTTLFVRPKAFEFLPGGITAEVYDNTDSFTIRLKAENFAKSVCLSLEENDCAFSDNWFDIHGEEEVCVMVEKNALPEGMTAEKLKAGLRIQNY
ncbi:glycoside hydrolase family 2 protein [Ruminococcus sp.]|uniref:beta-mannosidase n=1 Tax=Ruminococcus sp. TaxID=41978 RepID=UPI0025DC6A29|nr:glycoside hydrolase family 2 protein [Ruminococcus sp.]MBQ8968012.1 glycoside hydrolase family 2 protein [Ruminococcus sp.]